MAVTGKNKNYTWLNITLRHWLDTAENCKFPSVIMQEIINETFDRMNTVLSHVEAKINSNIAYESFIHIAQNMLTTRDNNLRFCQPNCVS